MVVGENLVYTVVAQLIGAIRQTFANCQNPDRMARNLGQFLGLADQFKGDPVDAAAGTVDKDADSTPKGLVDGLDLLPIPPKKIVSTDLGIVSSTWR